MGKIMRVHTKGKSNKNTLPNVSDDMRSSKSEIAERVKVHATPSYVGDSMCSLEGRRV
jgi:hypothetical protein